ncbi:MAG: DegQ family serine endoprotease [Gammaproteobacteria bacterium]|jgi:serine protease Do
MKRYRTLLILLVCFATLQGHAEEGGVESLRQTGKAFAAVARSVSPSVVSIQVEASAPEHRGGGRSSPFEGWPFGDDLFERFFGEPMPHGRAQPFPEARPRARANASGFVFAVDGDKSYILTNNHVVEKGGTILVRLRDGREFQARITGTDPQSEVAVIEIEAGGLRPLPLGDSSRLEVGEWVLAIGSPFGLSHSLTVGVVSATRRTSLGIADYEDFIQTDAAINPGNSGGPLVNLDGEAVGMNTAIFTRSGGYMGLGFAIPINLAKSVAQQLIEKGEVTRGYLGIVIQTLTPELAESFDLDETRGILVAQVGEDSPAARAGLRQGDVIVAYRGKPVTDIGEFRNRVALTAPGSRETLTVIRNGKQQTLDVVIGRFSQAEVVAGGQAPSSDALGLTAQTLTPELAAQFGLSGQRGVVVTRVERGSIAAGAGIQPGALILQVDRKPVATAAQFDRAVRESSADRRVLLLLRQGEVQQFAVLSW